MSAGLCGVLLALITCGSASQVQTVTADLGQDVVLPCQAPSSSPVLVVEWTRPDLGSEYVFLYRNSLSDPENQLDSFVNRVQLVDRGMRDGNLAVRLLRVSAADVGKYECHVIQERTTRRKRATFNTHPIITINLDVRAQTAVDTRGHAAALLSVTALVMVALVMVALIFVKHRRHLSSEKPVYDTDDLQQQ
ncbi:hypothetical protein PAMP_016093 [Pampus punctatissimus]